MALYMGNWSYDPTYRSYNPILTDRGPPCSNLPRNLLKDFSSLEAERFPVFRLISEDLSDIP